MRTTTPLNSIFKKVSIITTLCLSLTATITMAYATTSNYEDACVYNCEEAGEIGYDQTIIRGSIPDELVETKAPRCEPGEKEYLWMKFSSATGGWVEIPNSNTKHYQPEELFRTTYFLRCVRKKGCPTYIESNIIRIAVVDCMPSGIERDGESCLNEVISFSAHHVQTSKTVSYEWSFGDGASPSTASGPNSDVTYSTEGLKKITMTVSYGDCSFTYEEEIYIINCDCKGFYCRVSSYAECGVGGARANGYGGTEPYSYRWSNGSRSRRIDGVPSGSYGVTITDANGCECSKTVVIEDPTPVYCNAYVKKNPSRCGGSDGVAYASGSGGSGRYSYYWSNGQSGPIAYGLSAGTYSVLVTDRVSGCSRRCYVTLEDPSLGCRIESSNPVCDLKNGTAKAIPIGGSGFYKYIWSNNMTSQTISGLSAGTYQVVIIDLLTGCKSICTVTLETEEPDFDISLELTAANCNQNDKEEERLTAAFVEECHGVITAKLTGVNGADLDCEKGYDYLLIHNNSPNNLGGTFTIDNLTLEIPGLCSGESYKLKVTSNCTGCMITSNEIVIPDELKCDIEILNQPDCDNKDGAIKATIMGGSGNYSFSWGHTDNSNLDLYDLGEGFYSLKVIDNVYGCETFCNVTLKKPEDCCEDPFTVDLRLIRGQCASTEGGIVGLTVQNGMNGFTYSWTDGNITGGVAFNGQEVPIFGLSANANYCVTVTSGKDEDCVVEKCIEIPQLLELDCEIGETESISCAGANDGKITATVSGGSGSYTYQWSSSMGGCGVGYELGLEASTATTVTDPVANETGPMISDLGPGTYYLTVTDGTGCSSGYTTCQITICEPDPLGWDPGITNPTCDGDKMDGAIMANVFGGTPNYTYAWTGPDNFSSSEANISNLKPGTYTLNVTDANECMRTLMWDLPDPECPTECDCEEEPDSQNLFGLTLSNNGGQTSTHKIRFLGSSFDPDLCETTFSYKVTNCGSPDISHFNFGTTGSMYLSCFGPDDGISASGPNQEWKENDNAGISGLKFDQGINGECATQTVSFTLFGEVDITNSDFFFGIKAAGDDEQVAVPGPDCNGISSANCNTDRMATGQLSGDKLLTTSNEKKGGKLSLDFTTNAKVLGLTTIFPNPFHESVNILLEGELGQEVTIEVMNVTGQLIEQQKVDSNYSQHQINLTDQPRGIYLIKVSRDGLKPEIHKVVKQ